MDRKIVHMDDHALEKLWADLGDVHIDENECIETPFFIWSAGTPRERIYRWFDESHSKGMTWLMYEFK